MDKKVDIWMPLMIGDYLADTSHLDTTQHGAYLLLLMHYWRKGPLPNDPVQLANIAKLSTDAWSINEAVLMQFFIAGEDGLLHQKRSDRERAKWMDKKQTASTKAVNAAKTRWSGSQKRARSNATSNASGSATSSATSNAQAMLEPCPSPLPLPAPSPSAAEAVEVLEKKSPAQQTKSFSSPAAGVSQKNDTMDEAWMIARAVSEQTGITSPWGVDQVVQQARLELAAHPGDMDGIRDGMVRAWNTYRKCAKEGKLRTTQMSAQKFYGEGIWKSSALWGLKKGMRAYEPTAA